MSHSDLWFIHQLLLGPEEYDSEWGRSCHFCHSDHGRYDAPLEHYIDCPWLWACSHFGVPVDWAKHVVFEPEIKPCEECGYYYVFSDDWRGRDLPEPCAEELIEIHDAHIAESLHMTLEQYRAASPYALMLRSVNFHATRGGISFIKPPDVFKEP